MNGCFCQAVGQSQSVVAQTLSPELQHQLKHWIVGPNHACFHMLLCFSGFLEYSGINVGKSVNFHNLFCLPSI